ncbi:hypothetical protein AAE478_008365 [Parahypoxylon ruwenzoriense]
MGRNLSKPNLSYNTHHRIVVPNSNMDQLQAIFNHLVLPPQVPPCQDPDIESVSHDVLTRIIHACETADGLARSPWSEAFRALRDSLETCIVLNSGGLEVSTMLGHFRGLQPNCMLILHVVEQNAAVLVRRENCDNNDRIIFEAFETSASSEQVLAAGHAMQWDFPGRSAQLPYSTFMDESFQQSLATFLEQASMESLYNLQASTRKAKVSVIETRDTTDPALITQMLMPILEAMGSHFQAPLLRKRVRDEVNIYKKELPWRRLPFWLVLRVAAERQLCLALGNERGRISYKFLICVLLAELLEESVGKLSPELTITLRTKLCRRMAKIELDRTKIQPADADLYESLFSQISPMIKGVIQEATAQVEIAWKSFKQATTRNIPKFPLYAPDNATQLSLSNSGEYLDRLLSSKPTRQAAISSFGLPQPLDKAVIQAQEFTDHVFNLAAMEERIGREEQPVNTTARDYGANCIRLAGQIDEVFTTVGATYDADPEQMSSMILALFTLWVNLDKSAIAACPLLRDHQPAFNPELLDVLQLPTLSGMRRLQDIQAYLARRQTECQYGTMFDKIDENCFAVRYVARSTIMQSLESRIQSASDLARDLKEVEWTKTCAEYDKHTTGIQENTCRCSWENNQRNVRGCKRCWHWRVRNRMKIHVQEEFLPDQNPARALVTFELAIPSYLSAYRDATWRILLTLAHPSRPASSETPEIELMGSEPLQPYMTAKVQGISLASRIKTFNQTHYKFNTGKVPLSRLLLPLAADFELYDHASKLWVKDLTTPLTFQHLCGIHVPRGLQDTILPAAQHPPPVIDGPSSYEVQANQSHCPPRMSVHEFSAYQKLLAGKVRRWPNILVEMGSSHLNFSNEDTTRVLCHLSSQAGPRLPTEPLRAAHVVFQEPAFVDRLAEIIEKRLRAIQANWREHNYMELLITLCLRMFSLSSGASRDRATTLLKTAREATLDWTTSLRNELRTATDADSAQRVARYGFCAALLCRRTFEVYAELNQVISAENLATWVQASVALQENVLVSIDKLPQNLKRMLLRDTKMAYRLQELLKTSVIYDPGNIGLGITRCWTDSSDGSTAIFSEWRFLPTPHDRWIVATTLERLGIYSFSQLVHYNIVEGHLLVNGKPRGKLPLEILDSQIVKEIFGNQHLLTYPSSLPGMTHQLANFGYNQSVHFGMRDEQVVIRAWTKDGLVEYVRKEKFTGSNGFDLPAELVENCSHWLNFNTRRLEVRRTTWTSRPRDWFVDIPNRRAQRGNVSLVDPRSDIFIQISKVLEYFEQPRRLTVYQPQTGKLSIDLRHLDLSFVVNRSGLLECRQLNAEIDPDQDAGTWYGLQSKIVLRDMISWKRSIIVPLGGIRWIRHGMHVYVRVDDATGYGRYKIDDILGQLSCPPEPRLLFTKALYHAITSFCLPDTLTGRTGTEEAFSILRSGAAQPWVPLGPGTHPILKALEELPPKREYYPAQIKRFQTVIWDENLTITIQHDGYKALVRDIMEKSNRLNVFTNVTENNYIVKEPTHLQYRGKTGRQIYERPTLDSAGEITADSVYIPRDRITTSKAVNVYEIARLILTSCLSLPKQKKLRSILESSEVVGGFHGANTSLSNNEPLISQIEDPIVEQWGSLVSRCQRADDTAPLLFRLGLLAFNPEPNMDAIRSLTAFALIDELKILEPPKHSYFMDFKSRGPPPPELLQKLVASAYRKFKPRVSRRGEIQDQAGRNGQEHQVLCEEESRKLADYILAQWPLPAAELSVRSLKLEGIDVDSALEEIEPEWERRRKNSELEDFVNSAQRVLNSLKGRRHAIVPIDWVDTNPSFVGPGHSRIIPSISMDLVVKSGPTLSNPVAVDPFRTRRGALHDATRAPPTTGIPREAVELRNILSRFASSRNLMRQQYGGDLLQSLAALKDKDQSDARNVFAPDLGQAIKQARSIMALYLNRISTALASEDRRFQWLQLGAIWPCTTPVEVLTLLRSASAHDYGHSMKQALVNYGLTITNLQRLERISRALLQDDERALTEERRNPGHETWSPFGVPDWLLLEIDGDLLIRPEQVDVARAIIKPQSGQNSVLQMNMGKGKTSCIVPMVVSVLANGRNLSRLIVPKALLMQTAQTTQSRLGDLVGREVRHIPFSRKMRTTPEMLQLYEDLHHETRSLRGLILTSHEHVLSYKLGGWQHLADGKLDEAKSMIGFQNWLDNHCRDVLDECDFTLSVKTQLNYPSGPETTVDGHPFRWQVAQELLALVAHHVLSLQYQFPDGIEVLQRPGSFPIIHFLKTDAEDIIHNMILEDICAGRTTLLRPASSSFPFYRNIIRHVLSEKIFDERFFLKAVSAFSNPQAASKMLLVVRGLIVDRILLLCLSKRWNVQYGLHPKRHPVAVPFEAKGTPSEQSEFGHPDVAILFTCLAFYYTGLTSEQFQEGLKQVLQSDDPAAQYEEWISGSNNLPESLHHWNVINIEDGGQVEMLWEHLRLDRVVVNHYLNHFVFPVHAKQFEIKLQASAWDIPLYTQAGQRIAKTTGFSGTNDNRSMLPLTIHQDDLPSLRQTSAEVLSYLLQSRNRGYRVTRDTRGRRFTEAYLLQKLRDEGIRVLIDAGAYILEMDNKTLAQTWLGIDIQAKAAVYFGQDNRAWVLYRGEAKSEVPLIATPFVDNLSECVVYLDQAHTRGVDLKFPSDAHGALTLALKQTKDYTMQAAMRLRQLRTTQRITFFAPPEVDQGIREFCHLPSHVPPDSSHVVSWLLEQTCLVNEDLQGLYVAQGIDFCRRTDAIWHYRKPLTDTAHRAKLLSVLRQPECQTLEQLYGGTPTSSTDRVDRMSTSGLQEFTDQLILRSGERNALQTGALEEVEQEREVQQVQVEQVRQVQKQSWFEPLQFPGLHPTISRFARTGVLQDTESAQRDLGHEHAFAYVARTNIGKKFAVRGTNSRIFVSREFGKTIKHRRNKEDAADNFLRPVEWILWSPGTQTALVIIPEEAELLITHIRRAKGAYATHLIAYAAPITKGMLVFNRLQYYSLPPLPTEHTFPEWFRFELGILGGRLYVDLAEWDSLASYLQPSSQAADQLAEEYAQLSLTNGVTSTSFADEPASFVLEWLTLLRKTQDILHTPIGYICTGRTLGENHPFRESLS